jgi:hypothetical protein
MFFQEESRKNSTFPARIRYKHSSHPYGENHPFCITLHFESQHLLNACSSVAISVTKHHPKDFFMHFEFLTHHDLAVHQGTSRLAMRCSSSSCGAREAMPTDLVLPRSGIDREPPTQHVFIGGSWWGDDTKLFSCWMLCWSTTDIPVPCTH